MMYTIERTEPRPDFMVRLSYSDGAVVDFDVAPLIQQGGVYSALADPDQFSLVSVGERGRYIEWPGEIDFCADALRLAADSRTKTAAKVVT